MSSDGSQTSQQRSLARTGKKKEGRGATGRLRVPCSGARLQSRLSEPQSTVYEFKCVSSAKRTYEIQYPPRSPSREPAPRARECKSVQKACGRRVQRKPQPETTRRDRDRRRSPETPSKNTESRRDHRSIASLLSLACSTSCIAALKSASTDSKTRSSISSSNGTPCCCASRRASSSSLAEML
ncbi:hypothetical protein OH77DRAFT_939412 [Trametes cingulata]|nr:hypothetical protein OH77DRAFT_939412 [Trametes cingulata]